MKTKVKDINNVCIISFKKLLILFGMFMVVMPSIVFAGTINGANWSIFGDISLLIFTILMFASPVIGLVLIIWGIRYLNIMSKYKNNDSVKYKKLSSGMLKSLKKYILFLLSLVAIAFIFMFIDSMIS